MKFTLTRAELRDRDRVFAWLKTNKTRKWRRYGGLVEYSDAKAFKNYYVFCCLRDGIFYYVNEEVNT